MSLKHKALLFLLFMTLNAKRNRPFTVMLDPAGDAQHAGRKIHDYFERGLTLQCAEHLKEALEKSAPHLRIILTRFPGETLQPRQNASFANRLEVDLYISIHFFEKKESNPHAFLFYFCTDPITDFWKNPSTELTFIPFHQGHKQAIEQSVEQATTLYNFLHTNYKDYFSCNKPLGIPFKPLCGITAPAIGIECSLNTTQDWAHYVKPFSEGIIKIIEQVKKSGRNRVLS
jgi:hypothetical protein